MRKKVHIRDEAGNLLYTRLWDDGSNVLNFFDNFGFVTRDDVKRYRWKIEPGWVKTRAEEANILDY